MANAAAMSNTAPRAVIFDLDDTLIDFVERKRVVIREVVKAMVDAGLGGDFDKLHQDFSDFYWRQGIEDQRIFQKYLQRRAGHIDYKVLAHAILAYRRVNTGLLRPYPGAKRLLTTLRSRGYKLAILSDAPKLEAYLRLCSVGFDDLFDVILTLDDVKEVKPQSKGFLLAAKELGVKPGECVMVGDRPERDILGAKRLGMKTIFAKYGRHGDGADADFIAERPDQIAAILERMG
jgi:HAD superfamily hydrolase (TIGR02253 family)